MKLRNVIVVICLVGAISVGLYFVLDPFGPEHRHWFEEVDLGDGRVIQVERSVTFNVSNSLGGGAYNAIELEATIKFTGELAKLPPWSQPLMALVMYQDKETQEWVIVATTTSSDVLLQRGKPCPSYWEFHLESQGWREVPLSRASIGLPGNLLHLYQQHLGTNYISISTRKHREVPNRSFEAMNSIEKSYWKILGKDQAECKKIR